MPFVVQRGTRRFRKGLVVSLLKQDSIFIFVNKPTMAMETPWADGKLQVGASVTSYDDSDSCVISDHRAVSIINTEQKTFSAYDVSQARRTQSLTNQDYMEKIIEVNDKLDMVKDIVRPGCSYEVLNTALRYMSSLATSLSGKPQRLHASL